MSIQKRGDKYRVRYLEGGKHRSQTFFYSADAQQFERQVKLRKSRANCCQSKAETRRCKRSACSGSRTSCSPIRHR